MNFPPPNLIPFPTKAPRTCHSEDLLLNLAKKSEDPARKEPRVCWTLPQEGLSLCVLKRKRMSESGSLLQHEVPFMTFFHRQKREPCLADRASSMHRGKKSCFQHMTLQPRWANVPSRAESKCRGLGATGKLCHPYFTLPQWQGSGHSQCANEWARLCSSQTFGHCHMMFTCHKILFFS